MRGKMFAVLRADEGGELMIESILVMIPTLFVLVFILCLGFFFYQQWNVQVTANETASKVAEVYPLLESELKTGASEFAQVEAIAKYRYLHIISGDKYASQNTTRGKTYGKKYLSLVSLAYPEKTPEIEVKTVEDAYACRHVVVTVTGNYRLPFGEGFEVFGLKSSYQFSGHGEAVCTDLCDYLGGVNYLANLERLLRPNEFSGYKAVNSILSMIKKIAEAIDRFHK